MTLPQQVAKGGRTRTYRIRPSFPKELFCDMRTRVDSVVLESGRLLALTHPTGDASIDHQPDLDARVPGPSKYSAWGQA